jgi:hypothetical protein|tara:strand:- start:548 stop:730 length:183 start_codon:yes stop_codon:yes gene_type:complete
MFALGSKVVSKSHGIPGVVEAVQKYGGYQFLVVKVSGTHFIEGALLTKVYGKSHEFEVQQ